MDDFNLEFYREFMQRRGLELLKIFDLKGLPPVALVMDSSGDYQLMVIRVLFGYSSDDDESNDDESDE